jgi:peptide/nickel transport system substrate-binding protein
MDEIARVAYEGRIRPFQGPVPPEMFTADASIKGFTRDPARAQDLVRQVGANGARLELVYADDPTTTRFGELLQAQLKQIGLDLALVRVDQATQTQRQKSAQFDLLFTGLSNSSGDPWTLFSSELRSTGANNVAKHAHPQYDSLIDQIGAELDAKRRETLLNDFFRAYFEDVPFVATASTVTLYALNTRVRGFEGYPNFDLTSLIQVQLAA